MPVKYTVKEKGEFNVVEFELPGGLIQPAELEEAVKTAPEPEFGKATCISGRGPVWLFSALVHKYHPSPWVGVFDPRLGCVVVETHSPKRKVGEVVPI